MRHESTNPKAQKVSSMINPKTPAPRYIIITRLKQRDNLESSKKALTCYTQGILKKIHSWSLIGNHKGKKTMGRHNLYWKGKKNPSTKNPISSKSVLQKKEGQRLPWWLRTHLPMQKTWAQSLGGEDPPEEGMTMHSNILAWRIPWTEELVHGYSPWGCKELDMTEAT